MPPRFGPGARASAAEADRDIVEPRFRPDTTSSWVQRELADPAGWALLKPKDGIRRSLSVGGPSQSPAAEFGDPAVETVRAVHLGTLRRGRTS
jgi:hypothetical protein